jgi:hypothetical protein
MPRIAGNPVCANSRLKLHRQRVPSKPSLQPQRPPVGRAWRLARSWPQASAIEILCSSSASPVPWRFPRVLRNAVEWPALHHPSLRPAQTAATSHRSSPRGARQRTNRRRGWRHAAGPVPSRLHRPPTPGRHSRDPPYASPRRVPCWRLRPAPAASRMTIPWHHFPRPGENRCGGLCSSFRPPRREQRRFRPHG